ncbi:MAG: DUF6789 family protein [Thermomicrobiales bacterium]
MQPISRPLHSLHRPVVTHEFDRTDWLRASLIAGFIATFSMTICLAVAYAAANAIGDASGNTVQRWFAALSENELTRKVGDRFFVGMILNLVMGLIWAMIYARFAEPRLSGPGWRRGVVFSILPFILAVAVFFPIAGIGFLGSGISAGALPVIGSLILHLVYGAVLGALYAIDLRAGLSTADGESEAAEGSERGAVAGIVVGIILGYIGGWIVGPGMADLASRPVIGIAGALSGAAIGILIGSLIGMNVHDTPDR